MRAEIDGNRISVFGPTLSILLLVFTATSRPLTVKAKIVCEDMSCGDLPYPVVVHVSLSRGLIARLNAQKYIGSIGKHVLRVSVVLLIIDYCGNVNAEVWLGFLVSGCRCIMVFAQPEPVFEIGLQGSLD